ncbi:hypothetical protein [Sediminivirga luteola]|jgi:hypothetical protein|uniref:hypothetical protein n=1 Tax=Sediminivirga luteola TaxID=1774748 RepID=UPI001F597C7A|nr:hypothetical protein [Sediminivirga luteola]MCI2266167.1 hypothetical protein [Sediminivirga luteola]
MAAGVYVETVIDAGMGLLWQRTQDPHEHARWDLRFGQIVPEATAGDGAALSGGGGTALPLRHDDLSRRRRQRYR